MRKENLVYLCDGIASVFDSQVGELIKSISEKHIFERVYLFVGIKNRETLLKLRRKKLPKEIRIVIFKSYPNYPIFNFLLRRKIQKSLKNNQIDVSQTIFHVRGELLSWHLTKIIDIKYYKYVLPDIRGVSMEETIEFQKKVIFKTRLKLLNKKRALKSLKKNKIISAVSPSLKKYLAKYYNISPSLINVTPCLAGNNFKFENQQRQNIRIELNINSSENLFVFTSSSMGEYQNYQALQILADKDIKILNLSKHNFQHKNIINKYVEYDKVSSFLSAADVAIIWRNRSLVNKVASPVKFSEYISCGLPVISNCNIELISNYLKETKFGLLLESLKELDDKKINKLKLLNRYHISEYGRNWLGIEPITKKYINIYNQIQ